MRISINLLPHSQIEKEVKSPILLVPIAGLIAVIAAAGFLTYTYFDLNSQVDQLEQNISDQNSVKLDLQQSLSMKTIGLNEYNFLEKYVNVNEFIKTIYMDTVQLKSSVYHLLPEEAIIDSYAFTNSGELDVTVTFHSKGDAAIYLHRLLQAEFVKNAVITTINSDTEEILYTSQFQIELKTIVGEAL